LKVWKKHCFGDVHNYVRDTEQKDQQIQAQIQVSGHTHTLLAEEKLSLRAYEDALNR
jgi:predicted phosphodiesterase